MNNRILPVALAAILVASISEAHATQGWYLTGGVGGTFVQDSSSSQKDSFGNAVTWDTKFDAGFSGQGAAGYSWDSHGSAGGGAIFRVEAEVFYKMNDIDSLEFTSLTLAGIGTFTGLGTVDANGDISALGFMANAWYEFRTGMSWRPYIGGGIGTANISMNDVSTLVLGVDIPLADDSDWVLAYQFGAGVSYDLTRNVIIGLEYRFLRTSEPEFTDLAGVPFNGDYLSHSLSIIVRFVF